MKNKLPKTFKKKWIAALRSGDYLQTDSKLYNPNANDYQGGYCCLGVACIVAGLKNKNLNEVLIIDKLATKATAKGVPELLTGSQDPDNDNFNPIVDKLAEYNDAGKSFNWIASYIERYL